MILRKKPAQVLTGRAGERLVTIVDEQGATIEVSNYSEEYRHYCEAMEIIKMPSKSARHDYLRGTMDEHGKQYGGVRTKRGQAAVDRLEKSVRQLWYLRDK